jgi:catechol 2,3-dioxygenase-like lactoylglutathione lyase family enzyme
MTGMVISRAFANILTDDVAGTRDFYVDLLGSNVAFDSDWFVNLTTGSLDPEQGHGSPAAELGIWHRDHELIPAG